MAAGAAQDYCANHLIALGFTVARRPFAYSMMPGKFGAPIVGMIAAALLINAARLGQADNHLAIGLIPGACVIALVTALWMGGNEPIGLPVLRTSGSNLEAVRGMEPRVWLIAHIDSKSQPVSTAVRTLGVLLLALAAVVGVALSITTIWVSRPMAWVAVMALAAAGAIPLLCSVVGSRSDGAADNASGVAAVLEAAALVAPGTAMGVLITDAEELSLAGARRWVVAGAPGIAINCDTIDDDGRFVVMQYGDTIGLSAKALTATRAEDVRAMLIRPLPGVLTDSAALRGAGWATVTLSRGNLRTLNRIHTVRDNLQHLRGTGIPAAARVLARLVEEFA